MGKKSKRRRNVGGGHQQKPPAQRSTEEEEETKDNLKFEDPFVDIVEEDEDDDGWQDEEEMQDGEQQFKVWNPYSSSTKELIMDESAYKMHHALTLEWPCLSFDFLRDSLGESRSRFPHSLYCVAGSQAPDHNTLSVLKLSDLAAIKVETEDDILGEEYDNDNDDDDSSDDEEEEVDLDPCLEHFTLKHNGAVNRVRSMPQQSEMVATWSDLGKVHVWNVQSLMNQCSQDGGMQKAASTSTKQAIFTYSGHATEGFAMDWSTVTRGTLATGDCDGAIHTWVQSEAGDFVVTPMYESEDSVEDLQWSPTEATVLAGVECRGYCKIYDTRAPHRAMLSHQLSQKDLNVASWNGLVANLLATGDDDGVLSVWDLRNFDKPLARFASHQTPITSVEWHPTDESMLAVSDDNATYIYDLSVEEEDDSGEKQDIPPQLLFSHCGSEQFKEVHWHPQITSCLMTTALSGFSVFIPSNL